MEAIKPPGGYGENRRQLRGTWPWFAANMILFPAPAHFALLRVRDLRSGGSIKHLCMTFVLSTLLLAAACMQVVAPAIGRMWMLLPLLSGGLVLFGNRGLRPSFKPFDAAADIGGRARFILFFIALFSVISILPGLDFITMDEDPTRGYKLWLGDLPYWQDLLIMIVGLLVLVVGYATNATTPLSLNRAFILYACLVVFINLIAIITMLALSWLKIEGGFTTQLMIVVLAAILAIDYWDAVAIGQYIRRFFFLSCAKGLSLLFLWLCFIGLPQQAASVLAAYRFDRSRPMVGPNLNRHLVFTTHDRFISAHRAGRRLRSLYAAALQDARPDRLQHINHLMGGKAGNVFPADADVSRLATLAVQAKPDSAAGVFAAVPLFRPIQPEWDVMLSALLIQGTISPADLNNYVAGFKTMLPSTSSGSLPAIDAAHKAHYVSVATRTRVDFIEPQFDRLAALLEKKLCPVLGLTLAGKSYWAALVHIDDRSGIAWLRIELVGKLEKAIQLLFDAGEWRDVESEIRSRLIIPLTIDYLRDCLAQSAGVAVVFTPGGLDRLWPDRFTQASLDKMRRAVAFAADPVYPGIVADVDGSLAQPFTYADYLCRVASIKALISPRFYENSLLVRRDTVDPFPKGRKRLAVLEDRIARLGRTLRNQDRIDIADLLVKHNHVDAAPRLFMRLATANQVASDLVDCRQAHRIGRRLFLLGRHEDAQRYLRLAFLRHPFNAGYEWWYQINREKLNLPPTRFYSLPAQAPHLKLYYETLVDIRGGRRDAARKRLEKALNRDSHDSLAIHLLDKYFNRPLDPRHFFPSQEGL